MFSDNVATSPAIGIVIMVVLTVVLATSVVSLVFGFTDSQYQFNQFLELDDSEVYISDFELGGDDNTNEEWVKISNNRKSAVNLKDWVIKDCEPVCNYTYTLPSCDLDSGDSVTVHTGKGSNTNRNLYLGQENVSGTIAVTKFIFMILMETL